MIILADHCVCSWNWKRPARFYLYRLIVTILQITFVIMVSPSESYYMSQQMKNFSILPSGVFQSSTDLEFENQFYKTIKYFQSSANANKNSADKNARRKFPKYFFFDGLRHANRLKQHPIKSRLFHAVRAPITAWTA